eukprot:9484052-Pyramimonas_sp.AAC.1
MAGRRAPPPLRCPAEFQGWQKGKSGKGKGSVARDGQDTPGPGSDPQEHTVDDHRWETVFREDRNAQTAIGTAFPGLRQVAGKHMKSGALKLTTIDSSQG